MDVYTANLSVARRAPDLIDITVKSGYEAFAPTWSMVMGHKQGRVSDEEYIAAYVAKMRESYQHNRRIWEKLLAKPRVILGCYCPSEARFCHRYLLGEILERFGATIQGELLKDGEVRPIPRLAASYFIPQSDPSQDAGLKLERPAVAFTGHRPQKLGGFDPDAPLNRAIRQELARHIQQALDSGFTWFISGGALGTDQWAAEEVLRLGGKVLIARPFPGQEAKWRPAAREAYRQLLARADQVIDVSEGPYSPAKLDLRNRWMVDHSDAVIAVYGGYPGGTHDCIAYAKQHGKPITYIDPRKLNAACA